MLLILLTFGRSRLALLFANTNPRRYNLDDSDKLLMIRSHLIRVGLPRECTRGGKANVSASTFSRVTKFFVGEAVAVD